MSLNFIDIFCGIGGFHIALKNLGHKCVFACDIDKKCRETYETNLHLKQCILEFLEKFEIGLRNLINIIDNVTAFTLSLFARYGGFSAP